MIWAMKNETLLGEDDGLCIPTVGPWTEVKFDLVRLYCHIFSTAMKRKWTRVYVDLYAGSGLCRIEGSSQVLLGSPLIAMSVDSPFDRYIFSESDPIRFAALKQRIEKNHSDKDTYLIHGSFEEHIKEICAAIPSTALALCFVDPFDCDFDFLGLEKIAKSAHGVDFVCLLAVQMDAKRNLQHYLRPNSRIDRMLGNTAWRVRWKDRSDPREDFAKFVAREFAASMSSIGYLRTELRQMKEVKTHDKKVPLYYLAMFSKHSKAFDLWDEVLKYSNPQRNLF